MADGLRLLHIFSTFKVGGPQRRFAALVRGLGAEFAHDVVAMDDNYDAADEIPQGAPVRFLRPSHHGFLAERLRRYRRFVAKHTPDLLVTYNWGAIEWVMANAFGVPQIHVADGFGPEEAVHRLPRRNLFRRLVLPMTDAVVVPSETLRALAGAEWHLKDSLVHYIPNGIVPSILPPARPWTEPLLPRIAWVGALRPEKNLPRLLEAFAPLKDRAELVLAGDGPERPRLEALVQALGLEGRVQFLGHRRDVVAILAQARIVALSSDTEQMPLMVLEAMDAARPVASVDVGDVRLMVADENRPFVVARSASALSAALDALLRDPELCNRIGKANRRRLETVYHRDGMVARYRALFLQLARPALAAAP
ncbi:MAG TPA: glycosyltransferase [Rhizomicrobium sp.]|jgi:glycosyltransferase involved in cell wall biosynthesis|nr:glycosyltransferase [Rhizomicrobium sp.]